MDTLLLVEFDLHGYFCRAQISLTDLHIVALRWRTKEGPNSLHWIYGIDALPLEVLEGLLVAIREAVEDV